MRFLSGRGITLTHDFLNDETPVANVSAVSVSVTDASGTAVVTDLAATLIPTTDTYTASLGMLARGVYTATWTAKDAGAITLAIDSEEFEVVGNFLFSVAEARGSDSELTDVASYPAAEITGYREVIEGEFEQITGRSFTVRSKTFSFEHDGTDTHWLGVFDTISLESLETVALGVTTVLTVSDYHLDDNGLLRGLSALPEGTRINGRVTYGHAAPPPDLKRVALVRLRFLLAAETSGVPDRATSYVAAEGGTFTLATPGRNGYQTGIPDVDAVLNQYDYSIIRDVMGVG